MIADSSAIVAVLFGEPDASMYADAITNAESCRISAATFLEVSIVAESQGGKIGSLKWDAFLRTARITVEPVTEEMAYVARQAWSEFGKGNHPAGLNFGDCFSYALTKVLGESLLFKGDDFRKTDVLAAL